MGDDVKFVRVFRTDRADMRPEDGPTFISFMNEAPNEMFRATDTEFIARDGATPRECILALVKWVRKDEREACAKIAEDAEINGADTRHEEMVAAGIAAAIRARKDGA